MKKIQYSVVAFFLMTVPAFSADHIIEEKDKDFSQKEITIKVGDTVTFENKDNISHNVFSKDEANTFEIAKQDPGEKNTVPFNKEGKVKVKCAIHPKMKMTVDVKP